MDQWGDVTRTATPSYVTCMQPFGDAGGEKPAAGDSFRVTEDRQRSAETFPKESAGARLYPVSNEDEPRSDSERGGTQAQPQSRPRDSGVEAAAMNDVQRHGGIRLWQRCASRFQPMSNSEHLSWYQRQMVNKRLGVGNSAADHQVLWPRSGAHCFPDSSLESSSEYDDSDSQKLVLCQQAKLNKRCYSPRPPVLVPHPGAQKAAKKLTPELPSSVKAVTEKIASTSGSNALPATTSVQDDERQTPTEPPKSTLKKSCSAPGTRRKRATRGYTRKIKHKESCLTTASKDDNTTFSQVSPWDTFSSASRDCPSDNGSTISAIRLLSRGAKGRHRIKPAPKRKIPAPASRKKTARHSPKRIFRSLAETCETVSARKKVTSLTAPVCSSATRLTSDMNSIREENLKRQRYYESQSQRLKNIACCRALPAPPTSPCENKLPQIKLFPGVDGEGARVNRSQSISDLDTTPWSAVTLDASCPRLTTTLIEAVRVVDKVHGRKNNRSPKSSPTWAPHGTGDLSPVGNGIYWPSRPASAATNTDNNASCELSPTKPTSYDPVELLRKFRENLSCTRGKGLGATPRNEASHSRKPFSLKTIMRTLRKTQKQRALVPLVSYITYDAELAIMKPSNRFPLTSKESSKPRISFRSEASNSRFPSKIRSHTTKSRKTKKIFKKLIFV